MESTLLTGLGLAAPAGLNAYLPLLIVALADRFTNLIQLNRPYDFLSSTWGIVILVLLLTVEIVADKVPGVDHANDLLQTAVRPAAGAILVMAVGSEAGTINPVVAMVLGLLVAGTVHAAKAITRPAITVTTGGVGNPIVSLIEDSVAGVTAIIALVLPWLILLLLPLFGVFLVWTYRRLRRREPPPNARLAPNLRR